MPFFNFITPAFCCGEMCEEEQWLYFFNQCTRSLDVMCGANQLTPGGRSMNRWTLNCGRVWRSSRSDVDTSSRPRHNTRMQRINAPSPCELRMCSRSRSFGILSGRMISVKELDDLHWRLLGASGNGRVVQSSKIQEWRNLVKGLSMPNRSHGEL